MAEHSRLFGTEWPIIQAPMAGVQASALAIAVCDAGGLGSLPCAMLSLDAMRTELAAIARHTAKPFNSEQQQMPGRVGRRPDARPGR